MVGVLGCAATLACAADVTDLVAPQVAAFDGRVFAEGIRSLRGALEDEPLLAATARLNGGSVDAPVVSAAVPFPQLPDTLLVGSFHFVLGRTFARGTSPDRYEPLGGGDAPTDGVAFVLYGPEPDAAGEGGDVAGMFVASGLDRGPVLVFNWDHLIAKIVPGDWGLRLERQGATAVTYSYEEMFEDRDGEFGNLRSFHGQLGGGDRPVTFLVRRFRPAPAADGPAPEASYTVSLIAAGDPFRANLTGALVGPIPAPPSSVEVVAWGSAFTLERLDACRASSCAAMWTDFLLTVNGTRLGRVSRTRTGEFGVTVVGPRAMSRDTIIPLAEVLGTEQLDAVFGVQALAADVPLLFSALRGPVTMLLRLALSCESERNNACV